MKNFITTLVLACCLCASSFAQNQEPKDCCKAPDGKGRERMQAEMVCFMTERIGLTPEEAQAFWPVYNKIEAKQRELFAAEGKAFAALMDALKEENAGKANVDKLLNEYLAAMQANENLHARNVEQYKAVLPAEKVARFFASQEAFRRHMIGNLRGPRQDGSKQGGPRQGKPAKGGPEQGGPCNQCPRD